MKKSPFQLKDLHIQQLPKGTVVLCHFCAQPVATLVDMLLGEDEDIACPTCISREFPS